MFEKSSEREIELAVAPEAGSRRTRESQQFDQLAVAVHLRNRIFSSKIAVASSRTMSAKPSSRLGEAAGDPFRAGAGGEEAPESDIVELPLRVLPT